jgi:hypothetical protein
LKRDFWTKPSYQYNSIMLLGILSDNPGPSFTRNLDAKFVEVTKDLLRAGRDPSVRQILMETLDRFEMLRMHDEGLHMIIEMWRREKEKAYKAYGVGYPPSRIRRRGIYAKVTSQGRPVPPPTVAQGAPGFTGNVPFHDTHSQNYFSRSHSGRHLPDPVELANRLEEARTSAKLLEQVVAGTRPAEVLSNDLMKEFADRCLSASRSLQGYMTSTNPTPDNDTMESLIDTNEQLQTALSQHQRAVLNARKQLGQGERSNNHTSSNDAMFGAVQAPPGPPPTWQGQSTAAAATSSSRHNLSSTPPQVDTRPPPSPPSGKGKGPAGWQPSPPGGGPSRSTNGTSPVAPPSRNYSDNHPSEDDEEDPFRDPTPEPARGAHSGSGSGGGSNQPPRLAIDSFHPGFGSGGPTQSYLGRQDSAMDKVQMHGAAGPAEVISPVSEGTNTLGSTNSFGAAGKQPARGYDDDDDDDDRYGATPKKEGQVFRY